MNPALLTAFAALLAVAVSLFSIVQVRRAQKDTAEVGSKKIDAEAFERARDSYEAAIHQLEGQVARLTLELNSMRSQRDELEVRIQLLEKRHE